MICDVLAGISFRFILCDFFFFLPIYSPPHHSLKVQPHLGQQAVKEVHREPHHVVERSLYILQEHGPDALRGVGAGLVHGLSGPDVPGDLLVREGMEHNPAFGTAASLGSPGSDEANARKDGMRAT